MFKKRDLFNHYPGLKQYVPEAGEEFEEGAQMSGEELLTEPTRRYSFWPLSILVLLCAGLLVYRLGNLQISEGLKNRSFAEGNRTRTQIIVAPRGIITDRNGTRLAENKPAYFLVIEPFGLPRNQNERKEMLRRAEEITAVSAQEYENILGEHGNQVEPIVVREDVPRDKALLWMTKLNNNSAVKIESRPVRNYSKTGALGHVLGYLGQVSPEELDKNPKYRFSSITGKTGLEAVYEEQLQGVPGRKEVEVDSSGSFKRELKKVDPAPGNNLVLGIDLDLQKKAQESLEHWQKKSGGKSAVALVTDVRDGSVLSYVSLPTYDNNLFSTGRVKQQDYEKLINDKNQPLLDRAIGGLFPPGSSIKPVVASAGLQEKVITPETSITTPAEIKIGDFTFPDWKYHPGQTSVRRALAESNNIFFYSVGGGYGPISGLGPERLAKYYDLFGLEETTGLDLANEIEGFVPTVSWKEQTRKEQWYIGDTYHEAIGQGDLLVTPMELQMATATIANGGELLVPHLVTKITDSHNNPIKIFEKNIRREKFIESGYLQVVKEGMRQTVTSGSAQALNSLPVEVAGKTGTAQYGTENKTHAWFTSFAPYNNPEIALTVFIEGGGEGYQSAVPVAGDIYRQYFQGR